MVVDQQGQPVIDHATGEPKNPDNVVEGEKLVVDKEGKPVVDPDTGEPKDPDQAEADNAAVDE